ncbi:c-type cytochrome [bacterium]|nr:c-type cytochrome [bacterium]QQR59503.1 MAG: c-type cytochrome [Candidatus Melainabacteria bacterium]
MKFKSLTLLFTALLLALPLQSSAQNKNVDWSKTSLPPTGYKPAETTYASKQGRKLYTERNCSSCHQIGSQGGTMGPPLDGIGGHRGEEFLFDRLQNPFKQSLEFSELFGGKTSLMPHPGLNKKQAKQIAKYLLTLPEPEEGFAIQAHIDEKNTSSEIPKPNEEVESAGAKLGGELFLEHGCAACHTTYDNDPRFGPTLKGISQRKSKEEIERILSGKFKNRLMKKQTEVLDPQAIKCISEFLHKLPVEKKGN